MLRIEERQGKQALWGWKGTGNKAVDLERRAAAIASLLSPLPLVLLSGVLSLSVYPVGPRAAAPGIFFEQVAVIIGIHAVFFGLAWAVGFGLLNRTALSFIAYRIRYRQPLFFALMWRAAFAGGVVGLVLTLTVLVSLGISMLMFVDSYLNVFKSLEQWGVTVWTYGAVLLLMTPATGMLAAGLFWLLIRSDLRGRFTTEEKGDVSKQ